jgi:hypothetical protein
MDALDAHVSQVYEWLPWIGHYSASVPAVAEQRRQWLSSRYTPLCAVTDAQKPVLEKWYGKERAKLFKYTEAFEICEYGTQPDSAQIRKLFPMLSSFR